MESNKKRKSTASDDQKMKSAKIKQYFSPGGVTQATFDKLLLDFICESSQAFSVVEMASFKRLMAAAHPPRVVMTRKTLINRLEEAVKEMKTVIINKLRDVPFVATTTDCWSARQRSYLGVTCHWIDPKTLERHSVALACRRLKGSHTFDILAAALEEIHSEYHISEKVTRTTTDSGSNFLKAFREYGEKEEDPINGQEQVDSGSDDDSSDDAPEYHNVSAILDDDTGLEYHLPRHQKCACHLLNLVATIDAEAAGAGNEVYKRLLRSSMAKCNALWNKTSRSTVAFETVEHECKLQFLRPNQTRWSSLYLAVDRVVRIYKEQGEGAIRNVCSALKIKMLNPAEMGLADYAAVMKPVAAALNILQGETSVHMGFLLPTLYQLQDKLKKLETICKVCKPLLDALQHGIRRRFEDSMKDPELIAAAVLLPRFRTCWTSDESVLKSGLGFIQNHLASGFTNDDTSSGQSDEEDFFASMKSTKSQVGEVEGYLSSSAKEGMELLHSFPQVKHLSMKLNTALPASAACERLFSHAGILFTAKRITLLGKNLENQLLLKFNRHFMM
ncbi:uncharacterized protein LOC121635749 [Melanotaenia boesemani]|uniref:uncharacterized protein LOC121635749 n=1 Tax=Melanotaenia boesemani TaxID=1250792 RepID=UPI001C047994|nr:uncharacterized protein LOC121635749 [Melanotaenia boesemani]